MAWRGSSGFVGLVLGFGLRALSTRIDPPTLGENLPFFPPWGGSSLPSIKRGPPPAPLPQ